MRQFVWLAVIVILICLFLHPIDGDGDFFQHVNIGKHIVHNLSFPHRDNLTFTATGKEYIGYAWASGVIFYLIYSKIGYLGINFLVLSVALLTFAMLFTFLRLLKVKPYVACLAFLLTAPVMATRWPSRPEIFQFPLILGILLIDKLKSKRPNIVFLFPIIIFLWAQLYGSSAILGILVIAILLVGDFIDTHKLLPVYIVSLVASVLFSLLNPYGLKSLFFITYIPKMTRLWGDWGGLFDILSDPNLFGFPKFILITYFVYLVVFIGLFLKSKPNLKENFAYIFFSLFLIVPVFALRHRGLAVLFSLPLLGLMLDSVIPKINSKLFSSLLIVTIFLCAYITYSIPPNIGQNENIFPQNLIRFIKSNKLKGNAFNTQQIGSFLEYELNPQIKTFTDTRDELFIGTGVLEETEIMLSNGASISYLLRKHNVDIIIWNTNDGPSLNDLMRDTNWKIIYDTPPYLIFVPLLKSTHVESIL